ncbi:MAG: peroxide stress protein YaaA [Polymorphobacter sp.]|uniref:peroxide stress protein YaaA n=1 Tax=Polymorphobacter sp. TaxID=1909290 RepID=UPI003A885247
MLILLSPAKTLDLETPLPAVEPSQPRFLKTAEALAHEAATLSPAALQKLMHISEPLADLNAARFRAFETPFTPENARPAIFTFAGDVYAGLDAASLSPAALAHAQRHLRILSGLYGVLRPLDLMQPYRLEMGTRFGLGQTDSLYETWGDQLARALNDDLAGQATPLIVNLASNEYWKAVDQAALAAPVLTIDFRDEVDGKLRFNSFIAKRARGAAARLLLEAAAESPDMLKTADVLGHRFSQTGSTDSSWMFVRPRS